MIAEARRPKPNSRRSQHAPRKGRPRNDQIMFDRKLEERISTRTKPSRQIRPSSGSPTKRRPCSVSPSRGVRNSCIGDVELERAKGIEPSYAAWEAAVLPLNYARIGSCLAEKLSLPRRAFQRVCDAYCAAAQIEVPSATPTSAHCEFS